MAATQSGWGLRTITVADQVLSSASHVLAVVLVAPALSADVSASRPAAILGFKVRAQARPLIVHRLTAR